MEQSPSWEANSRSVSQEIHLPCIEPEGLLPFSQEPATGSYLEPNETSPYLPPYFFKIHFNPEDFLSSTTRSSK
jgi:hypothetical protein